MMDRSLPAPVPVARRSTGAPGVFGASNPLLREWTGQRVWLVGASSGIGLALAQALHARGAQVLVSARHAAALDDFVRLHPGSTAVPLDATDIDAFRSAARDVLQHGPGQPLDREQVDQLVMAVELRVAAPAQGCRGGAHALTGLTGARS